MAEFKFEITEILQKIVTQNSTSLEEAYAKVKDRYYHEDIILDAEDLKDQTIEQYIDDDTYNKQFEDFEYSTFFFQKALKEFNTLSLNEIARLPFVNAANILKDFQKIKTKEE